MDGRAAEDGALEYGGPGADTVVTRLIDVLFMHILRAYLATIEDGSRGWPPSARRSSGFSA